MLAPAVTDAGSIDGPVVTVAFTGNRATASAHRCSRSVWPCSLWGLLNIGTYRNLVIERGWSPEQYRCWVRDTIRLQIAAV